MLDPADRVVMVPGAARGIGRAVVEGPLADGFRVSAGIRAYSLVRTAGGGPAGVPRSTCRCRRILLQGDVPSPAASPSGCTFPRRCADMVPELGKVAARHWKACVRDYLALAAPVAVPALRPTQAD